MQQLLRRAWHLIRRGRLEADLAEEIEFHRAMKQREMEERGLAPVEAVLATRRALGSVALAEDRARDVWQPRWLRGLGQDFRLAVRSLFAARMVSVVAVASLALGIGANTAIFSLVNSLLLRALPVQDPDRLAILVDTGQVPPSWTNPIWERLRERQQLFDGAFAWASDQFNLAQGGEAQLVNGIWASGGFFDVLKVRASLGRTFNPSDDQRGGGPDGPVAIIGHAFWLRHFGGSPDVIGRSFRLGTVRTALVAGRDIYERDQQNTSRVALVNEAFSRMFLGGTNPVGRSIELATPAAPPFEIVGLVRNAVYRSLRDPAPPTLYLPATQRPAARPAVALSVLTATGSPAVLSRSLAAAIERVDPDLVLQFRSLDEQVDASLTQERIVALLSGFFGGLALILAALGLYGVTSYSVSRRRSEIGIRMALGAAPGSVMRLVLSRVFVLVGAGVVIGGAVSLWASRYVASLLFGLEPRDPATLVGATAVLATVGALAAWLPARRASRIDPAAVLRNE